MCTGLEIAAIVAPIVGGVINNQIQNSAIEDQNRQNQMTMMMEARARQEEAARQREFEQQQAQLVADALFKVAPEKVEEEAAVIANNPETPINAALDDFNTIEQAGQVQNEDVQETVGATIAKKTAQTREMLRHAATLAGQFDAFSLGDEAIGRMSSEIDSIGSNRRGSINASRMETTLPAPTVQASGSPIGDLLVLGGAALGGVAGNRIGASGGAKPFDLGRVFSTNRPLNAIPALGKVTV